MEERDGFVVRRLATKEEVRFIPCTADSARVRERTLMGLLINANTDDFVIIDTRDEAPTES